MKNSNCTEQINTLCSACSCMKVESIDYDHTHSECTEGHWQGNAMYNAVMEL